MKILFLWGISMVVPIKMVICHKWKWWLVNTNFYTKIKGLTHPQWKKPLTHGLLRLESPQLMYATTNVINIISSHWYFIIFKEKHNGKEITKHKADKSHNH